MSKLIELKFHPDMVSAIFDGRKCCTTRSERKGEPGDIFIVDGRVFRIVDVKPHGLEFILNQYYLLEGFESTDDFRRFLHRIWRGHVNTARVYFAHFFTHVVDKEE